MESRQKNIGVNAALNVIRQGMSVIFPLITYPYALRVLGVNAIGKVNYGSSIVSYFSLIAMLGVSNYAVREGAKKKENRQKFEEFADQIFTINIISTIVSYALLVLTLTFVNSLHSYAALILIQSISILLTTLSVDWINTVYEDFLIITIRSIVTHLVTLALLFIFVKSPDDYYIYAMLTVVTNGIICVTNLFYVRRYANVHITRRIDASKHLKPIFILFANSLAISIYVNLDTTMLGWMQGDYYVGIYSSAVRIYNIAKNMMAAIYVVAVPRLSLYAGNENWDEYKHLSTNIFKSLTTLLLPAGIGLICLSPEIMLLLGGSDYLEASSVLQILGGSLIFAIFGGFITAGINISLGREKYTLIATTISAFINFGLNLIFIPLFSYNGAAFTTLLSELFVFIFCLAILPDKEKYINFRSFLKSIINSSLGCIFIIFETITIKHFINNYLIRFGLIFVIGVVGYGMILILLHDEIVVMLLNSFKRKFLKK